MLRTLHLTGAFSHILLDEASQHLEPAIFIPLTLATPRTVVVIGGDDKQLGPQIFSKCVGRTVWVRGGRGCVLPCSASHSHPALWVTQSSSTLESHSQNHSQKRRMH